jgi:hypothetical protein
VGEAQGATVCGWRDVQCDDREIVVALSGDAPCEDDAAWRIEFEICADVVDLDVAAADLVGEGAADAWLVADVQDFLLAQETRCGAAAKVWTAMAVGL